MMGPHATMDAQGGEGGVATAAVRLDMSPPPANADINATKSSSDKKVYRLATFKWHQDAAHFRSRFGWKKAPRALSVGVGFLSDPPELEGCAHFLEHMISMGSEKYPGTNDFAGFLAAHGGYDNAHTDSEATVYSFEVTMRPLWEAHLRDLQHALRVPFSLERHGKRRCGRSSQSFSFARKAMERGLLLSSHRAAGMRARQLTRFILCVDIWMGQSQIACRNSGSKGPDAPTCLEIMRTFYKEFYGARTMRLVVYGQSSLDELESHARAAGFVDIQSGPDRTTFAAHGPPALCSLARMFVLSKSRCC